MCERTSAALVSAIWLLVSLIIYIIFLVLHLWVETDSHRWSLWSSCSLPDKEKSQTEDKEDTLCETIHPGASPLYFEVVRGMVMVTLILHVAYWIILIGWSPKKGVPNVMAFLYCGSAAAAFAVLGTNYKTDERWKDSNPRLGASFYVSLSVAASNMLCFLLYATSIRDSDQPPRPPRTPREEKRCRICCGKVPSPRKTFTRRQSNASSLSIESGRKMTIFHTHTPPLRCAPADIHITVVDHRAERPVSRGVTLSDEYCIQRDAAAVLAWRSGLQNPTLGDGRRPPTDIEFRRFPRV